MPQRTKKMSLRSLRKLLEKSLIHGPRWYRPQADPTEQPTWKDCYQLMLNAYVMALEDVLKALNGNSADLEKTCPADPHRKSGRPLYIDPSSFPWRKPKGTAHMTVQSSTINPDSYNVGRFPANTRSDED